LQTHVAATRSSCDGAEKRLQQTDESGKSLLERAGNLREERSPFSVSGRIKTRQEVEVKRSIVFLFLLRFILTEEETEAMVSRDILIGRRFFAAVKKTEKVREDCRVLIAGEDQAEEEKISDMEDVVKTFADDDSLNPRNDSYRPRSELSVGALTSHSTTQLAHGQVEGFTSHHIS